MRKTKVFKCPFDNKVFSSLDAWAAYIEKMYPDKIPKDMTTRQYYYYLQTGKTHGTCIICKVNTRWNEDTLKYSRFCDNPKCKEAYREMFRKRMIDAHGKIHLLNDPEQQRKMLSNRKISGTYEFADGGKISYVGTYERDFLFMLDQLMGFISSDIMSPSPHTYYYEYKNDQDPSQIERRFYIPDFYIPSLTLEIEIKQGTNKHPKMVAVDKVKEELKDEMMSRLPDINYMKLVDKEYSHFFNYLFRLKMELLDSK